MKDRSFILVCLLLSALVACQKENTSNSTKTTTPPVSFHASFLPLLNTDGFGPSTRPLAGKPYAFPAGVTMSGSITTNANACTGGAYYECMTDGDLPFYMSLRNNNNVPATIIFPAGLVIPCADTTLQGAVLVQPDTFTIPASSSLCVNLNAECINEHRTFKYEQAYGAPLISYNYNLDPLIDLLSTKPTIINDPNDVVQQAVWDIANTGQMTQADITAIKALP